MHSWDYLKEIKLFSWFTLFCPFKLKLNLSHDPNVYTVCYQSSFEIYCSHIKSIYIYIYRCFHPEDKSSPTTFTEVFQCMFDYIARLFVMVRPRKLLFVAIGEYYYIICSVFVSLHCMNFGLYNFDIRKSRSALIEKIIV
jgi:hypothetical protein